jgi:branched-subunit amino acid aminotransferase/4-amino-4-deoxychorismate lyase
MLTNAAKSPNVPPRIFLSSGAACFLPPLNSGCLGVTWRTFFEISGRSRNDRERQPLRAEDLYAADEVFISSTNRHVIGVGEVAGHKFVGAPGPVTQRINEAFTTYVNDYVTRRLAAASR